MFSNTTNNSANDKVKTRPRWKAYLNFISFFKNNQQKIALVIGYLLVGGLFWGLGKYSAQSLNQEIRVEEPPIDITQIYNTLKSTEMQSKNNQESTVAGEGAELNCEGKIKGNISSSGKIYHVPGGAFYKRTVPEICFSTEADAQAAGFRKSKR